MFYTKTSASLADTETFQQSLTAVNAITFNEGSNLSWEPMVKAQLLSDPIPQTTSGSHSKPRQHFKPTNSKMSPNEFLYTISKECDRFKQSIIEKMEDYFASCSNQGSGPSSSGGSRIKESSKRKYVENSDWEDSASDDEDDDMPLKKIRK